METTLYFLNVSGQISIGKPDHRHDDSTRHMNGCSHLSPPSPCWDLLHWWVTGRFCHQSRTLTARNTDDIAVSTASIPGFVTSPLPNVGPKMSHIFLPRSTGGEGCFRERLCVPGLKGAAGGGFTHLALVFRVTQTFVAASSGHVQDNGISAQELLVSTKATSSTSHLNSTISLNPPIFLQLYSV